MPCQVQMRLQQAQKVFQLASWVESILIDLCFD